MPYCPGRKRRPDFTRATLFQILMMVLILLPGTIPAVLAGPKPMPIVVIDPGHGGQDIGAKGIGGALEKSISLALADQLANSLKGRYKIHLTRSNDTSLSPDERAGKANQVNGRLLISIHAGAAFRPSVGGCRVYYHQAPAGTTPSESLPTITAWHQRQAPHGPESVRLARLMSDRLRAGSTEPVRIQGAPLAMLAGADMPAVVVEIGYLTHPANEQRYTDPAFRVRTVQAMVWAINDFFDGRHAILSEDLKD